MASRYGEDASLLTENAAYAVGNAVLTAHYVGSIGPKAVGIRVHAMKGFIL